MFISFQTEDTRILSFLVKMDIITWYSSLNLKNTKTKHKIG